MAESITTQDIIDAKRDIEDIGEAVNEVKIVSPRYGEDFKSLPMIVEEFQDAINTIVIDDGVPALAVSDATGRNQQQVNDGVDSLTDLRLIDPKIKGRRVYLNSVIADKNLGGGTFVSTNKSSLVDNGGTIIDSANPNLMWVRVEYDVMTPEMFGCIGDGVADDTDGMIKFGLAKYNHKIASNDYFLTTTPVFNIQHSNSAIDFSGSKIIGTNFDYTAIRIRTEIPVDSILFKCGSYDGGHEVNGYVELMAPSGGRAENIIIECYGDLRNFANTKNTRGAAGIRSNIPCKTVIVKNPVVSDVRNINGVSGTSGAVGVSLTNYEQLGIIEDPIITGVYTDNGVDADGLVLFERKDYLTTGSGIGIVKNATLNQCCGRGIKSQSNLIVRGANINLSAPEFGVIISSWRGIDAQIGGMHCTDINFDLTGETLFSPTGGSTLFQSSGSNISPQDQIVKGVTVKGNSSIRHFMQLSSNNHKSIVLDGIKLLDSQSNLNCLYVNAGISVTGTISFNNLSSGWRSVGRLFFDTTYNGSNIPKLNVSNVDWDGYPTLDVSKFDEIRVANTEITIQGVLSYDAISKDSSFYYSYETAELGGLTYSNPNIPTWAKRYVHYERGVVLSNLKNNTLILSNTGSFYQKLTDPPTVISQ